MGQRTVKRVPFDFDWPLKETWKGYINPHHKPCPEAEKTCFNGENAAAKYLSAVCSALAWAGGDALKGTTHPYFGNDGWFYNAPKWEGQPEYVRKQMVELVSRLVGEGPGFGGFAGSDFVIYFKILEMVGLKSEWDEKKEKREGDWGHCQVCKGKAMDPAVAKEYEAWKDYEPPKGVGWQLWETCSEGSPVSPVFPTPDELAGWCEKNATIFAREKMSRAEWLKMFKAEDGIDTDMGSFMTVTTKGKISSVAQDPDFHKGSSQKGS